MQNLPVIIYTDGSCSGNPGPGGWAAIIRHSDNTVEIMGGENLTTNNRMELMAAILSLSYVQEKLEYWSSVEIYTDSQYVRNGITNWLAAWKRNGWKTASKTPVKNVDLWMQLDKINTLISPQWRWVKGHAGDEYNEKCNQLAIEISQQYKQKSQSRIY